MTDAIANTKLPLKLIAQGKVRDVYEVDSERLLLVATDRISAFDVVLPQPIPSKGEVLTQLTAWWLTQLEDITPNHLITADAATIAREIPALAETRAAWAGRSMLVKRTKVVPIECVVRGYISGSAWSEYRKQGTLAGEKLPDGLQESQRLDPPIFSPATKAETGHDENITFDQMRDAVGDDLANELKQRSLAIYQRGRDVAEKAGIILADTKFEFGHLADGTLILIDEVLTPDSSRFWPQESYAAGRGQPSLDKQPVRDHLEEVVKRGEWNKEPPAPELPSQVVNTTADRYRNVFQRLTGYALAEFPSAAPGTPPPAHGARASVQRMKPVRPRLQRGVIILPSALTVGNLFFGIWAIVSAARGDFERAAWLIVIAGILDTLDGRVARVTQTGSRFGEELDSLVDAISFGVAPALIMYFLFLQEGWGWIAAFFYVTAAVTRLARFNVEQAGHAKVSFHGLPSPSAGMLLATYYPFSQTDFFREHLAHIVKWPEIMTGLMFTAAILMMSHVLYPVVPKFGFRTRKGIFNGIFILTVLVLGLTIPSIFFFPALLTYVAYGVFKSLVLGLFERMPDKDPMEDVDEEEEQGDEAGAELRDIDYGELSSPHSKRPGDRRRPPSGRRTEDI